MPVASCQYPVPRKNNTSTQRKKGAGVIRTLFLSIFLLYQFRPTYRDKFSNFILSSDAATYGENRENGGLTRFAEIEMERVSCEHPG